MLAYDIGAFDGDTVEMIRKLGYSKIVCFEPHPSAFLRLHNKYMNDERVVAVNLAVSNISGKKVKMISSPEHPYLNSLEKSWSEINRHSKHISNKSECIVQTVSLDDYINQHKNIPAYIKIDAEGHELEIFNGLSHKPNMISFEWISEFYEKNINCLIKLSKLGFSKFNVSEKESIPILYDIKYSMDKCCEKLKNIHDSDNERVKWGNIWCV